jgi:Flp pilus assembly protein TadD
MKTLIGLIVSFGLVSCANEAAAPPPQTPQASVPAPTTAAVMATPQTDVTPTAPEKRIITTTTSSPEAKAKFLVAWGLASNGRPEEAREQCLQAVALDADFAFGHTCVGAFTPGTAGQTELDKGAALGAKLPDAERTFIEALAAGRRADVATAHAKLKSLPALAPDDYRSFVALGDVLFEERDFAGSQTANEKALAIDPSQASIHGSLAWLHVNQRDWDGALVEARKYVEGAPNEQLAHKTLADALLATNKVKDAEAELTKSVTLGAKTTRAYYDLAAIRSLNGDFAAAHDALEKSKQFETQDSDALLRAYETTMLLFTEGKANDALKLLDATEKDVDARKMSWPDLPALTHARASLVMGKYDEALRIAEGVAPRCDRPESSAAHKAGCRVDRLVIMTFAQLAKKDVANARKSVAQLRDEAKGQPGNEWLRLNGDLLSDLTTALEKKDAKTAAAVATKCPPDDVVMKLGALRVVEALGDKKATEAVRTELLGRPQHDSVFPLVAKAAKSK